MKTKFLLAITLVLALSVGSAFATTTKATAATGLNAKSSEQPHHWRHHHRHHHHMMKH
jgi:hypothetical protein